jgi:hypothetical protein
LNAEQRMTNEELSKIKQLRILILASRAKYRKLELLRRQELKNRHLRKKVEDRREIQEETIEEHTLEAYKLKFLLKKALHIFNKFKFKKCEIYKIHQEAISLFCNSNFPEITKHICLDICPHFVGNSIYWAAIFFNHLIIKKKATYITPLLNGYKSFSNYDDEEDIKKMLDYIKYEHNNKIK